MNHFSSSHLAIGAAFLDFTRRAVSQADEIVPQLVALPAGEFIMGENADDKFANDTERPSHRVAIPGPFALGIYPLRVGEFRRFRPDHSAHEPAAWPVVSVSWQEATDYCQWLTVQSGRRFRLPSEAEWEYACRAGTSTPFAPGDDITTADANFLYDETGRRIGPENRTPVGSYPPNAFGLHDLHGNVCEWVADSWHPNYLAAPRDGQAWIQTNDERRVIRGGAWDYLPRLLRSSWRDWRVKSYRADNLGFRVATSDF